jgi:hypothetical protein
MIRHQQTRKLSGWQKGGTCVFLPVVPCHDNAMQREKASLVWNGQLARKLFQDYNYLLQMAIRSSEMVGKMQARFLPKVCN